MESREFQKYSALYGESQDAWVRISADDVKTHLNISHDNDPVRRKKNFPPHLT